MALTGAVSYGRQLMKALLSGLLEGTSDLYTVKVRSVSNCKLQLTAVSSGRGLHVMHASQLKRKWIHGDDAYFIARHKLADVLGVADGVGGWRSYGVDPSKFSSTLMNTCAQMVHRSAFQPQRPSTILSTSYYEILDAKQSLIGSCTACIVSFNRADSTLYAANLGDSGFVVVRGNRIVHRSREQQHYFNAPYQLAVAPPEQLDSVFADKPEVAEQSSFSLQEGDIVIVGTDGLFDNVDDATLLAFLPALVEDDGTDTIQRVADAIVRRAVELSYDPQYNSPFARHAKASGIALHGGKPDDITLLLAKVTRKDSVSDSDSESELALDSRRAKSLEDVNDDNHTVPTRSASDLHFAKRVADSVNSVSVNSSVVTRREAPLIKSVGHVVAQSAAHVLGLRNCASAPSLVSLNTELNTTVNVLSPGSPLPQRDTYTSVFSLPLD